MTYDVRPIFLVTASKNIAGTVGDRWVNRWERGRGIIQNPITKIGSILNFKKARKIVCILRNRIEMLDSKTFQKNHDSSSSTISSKFRPIPNCFSLMKWNEKIFFALSTNSRIIAVKDFNFKEFSSFTLEEDESFQMCKLLSRNNDRIIVSHKASMNFSVYSFLEEKNKMGFIGRIKNLKHKVGNFDSSKFTMISSKLHYNRFYFTSLPGMVTMSSESSPTIVKRVNFLDKEVEKEFFIGFPVTVMEVIVQDCFQDDDNRSEVLVMGGKSSDLLFVDCGSGSRIKSISLDYSVTAMYNFKEKYLIFGDSRGYANMIDLIPPPNRRRDDYQVILEGKKVNRCESITSIELSNFTRISIDFSCGGIGVLARCKVCNLNSFNGLIHMEMMDLRERIHFLLDESELVEDVSSGFGSEVLKCHFFNIHLSNKSLRNVLKCFL